MRLICFWCAILAVIVHGQDQDGYYVPQTFKQNVARQVLFQPMDRPWDSKQNRVDSNNKGLFSPTTINDVTPQGSDSGQWRQDQNWRGPSGLYTKSEAWRPPFSYTTKEQQAAILHHKQSLTSEGNFRFEYASDNGLAAGEVIEPDGTRVGAYQYKDPSGQLVKLKYRAGKDGFQILEGSHIPKSPEPLPPPSSNHNYQEAYEQQRRQFELQQQYNQQRPQPQIQQWGGNQGYDSKSVGGQNRQNWSAASNWRPASRDDDGQYRDNEIEEQSSGPHSFGQGYAFSFQG